jgi:hypothetical protein
MIFKNQYYYEVSNDYIIENKLHFYGAFFNNLSKNDFENDITDEELEFFNGFWDSNDYIVISDNTEFFQIYTNFAIKNLSLGCCAEDPQYARQCDSKQEDTCRKGDVSHNGIQTGKCVETYDYGMGVTNDTNFLLVCEIQSWCPVAFWPHLKEDKPATLVKAGEAIMFLQNFIEFPDFGVEMSTVSEPEFDCLFHPIFNKSCPFFRIKDIVKFAHNNKDDFDIIAKYKGDEIEIKIEWKCIQGYECQPEISFNRLEDEVSNPGSMWSFWRYETINHFHRTSLFGLKIRFQITTTGTLKRLSWSFIFDSLIDYIVTVGIYECFFMTIVSCFSMNTRGGDFVYCVPLVKLMKFIFSRRKSVDFKKHVNGYTLEKI